MTDKSPWYLEVRENGTDRVIKRHGPFTEKKADALGLLICMGIKDGLHTYALPKSEVDFSHKPVEGKSAKGKEG